MQYTKLIYLGFYKFIIIIIMFKLNYEILFLKNLNSYVKLVLRFKQ